MKIDAIIPLREKDVLNKDGSERFNFNGIPLYEFTLKQIEESKCIRKVFFAVDSLSLKKFIKKRCSHVNFIMRPKKFSEKKITTLDVLSYLIKNNEYKSAGLDKFAYFEITHAYRPKGFIKQIIEMSEKNDFDSIITTRKVNYNIWTKDKKNIFQRIKPLTEKEDGFHYEELLGICSIFKIKNFLNENTFGNQVSVISIDNFWSSIDIRDKKSFDFFVKNFSYLKKEFG